MTFGIENKIFDEFDLTGNVRFDCCDTQPIMETFTSKKEISVDN